MPPMSISAHISNLSTDSTDEQLFSVVKSIQAKYPHSSEVAACLALKLAESGAMVRPPDNAFSADIASTGGPSSLSTLLAPLFLRAAGALVPKLGVPGRPAGGIDCLIQIPGYQAWLSKSEVEEILTTGGYAHFLSGDQVAPLDSRVFRIRQQHGAQNVPTLVIASLLSKKIAVGIQRAGLDVRVAPFGNFGDDWNKAEFNARLFIETANQLSISAFPVLTDARYPYQPYIGRCEALIGLDDIFKSHDSKWLEEHVESCRILALSCVPQEARSLVKNASRSLLRHHFNNNLLNQGSTPENFDQLVSSARNQHIHQLKANTDGFVCFPLEKIRDVFVVWQKRGEREGVPFPDPVGLCLCRRPGEWVSQGELLATVRITNGHDRAVMQDLENCICQTLQHAEGPGIKEVK